MKGRYLSWHFSYRLRGKRRLSQIHFANGKTAEECKRILLLNEGYKEPVTVWPYVWNIRSKRR